MVNGGEASKLRSIGVKTYGLTTPSFQASTNHGRLDISHLNRSRVRKSNSGRFSVDGTGLSKMSQVQYTSELFLQGADMTKCLAELCTFLVEDTLGAFIAVGQLKLWCHLTF